MATRSLPPPDAGWGSDPAGLIAGFAFAPGAAPRPLDSPAAADWLEAGGEAPEDGRFLWLHFDLAHAGTLRWLQRHADLPPGFFDNLGSPARSTRVERDGEALVAVVNDVKFDFDFDAGDLSTLWVCLDRGLVVTCRQQRLRSIDALRTRIKAGEPLRTPLQLLDYLLHEQCDVLTDIVRQVTRRADEIEDRLLAGRPAVQRAALGSIRRLLVRLQRLMAPEPASLFRLLQQWRGALPADLTYRVTVDVALVREGPGQQYKVALGGSARLPKGSELVVGAVVDGTPQATFDLASAASRVTSFAFSSSPIRFLQASNIASTRTRYWRIVQASTILVRSLRASNDIAQGQGRAR